MDSEQRECAQYSFQLFHIASAARKIWKKTLLLWYHMCKYVGLYTFRNW